MLEIKNFKNPGVEEKLKSMQAIGIDIQQFIEWAILNFNIETYLKVINCEQL